MSVDRIALDNAFALGRESVIGLRGPWVEIDDDQADRLPRGMTVRLSDGRCAIEGPLDSIGAGPTYYLEGKGLAMENPARVQVREADLPKVGQPDESSRTSSGRSVHHMVAGSHEFNGVPECRCGEAWDWWRDECARPDDDEPPAPFERAGLLETIDRIRADLVATEPAALLSEVKRLRSENADLRRSRDQRKAEEHQRRVEDRAAFKATIEPELAKQRAQIARLRLGLRLLYKHGTGRSLAPFDPLLPFVGRSSANNAVLDHDIEWRDRVKAVLIS